LHRNRRWLERRAWLFSRREQGFFGYGTVFGHAERMSDALTGRANWDHHGGRLDRRYAEIGHMGFGEVQTGLRHKTLFRGMPERCAEMPLDGLRPR